MFKHYFTLNRILILLVTLSILPQMIFLPFKSSLLLFWVFLLLLPRVSKSLFTLFILFFNVLNIIQAHVSMHWGGDLLTRVGVTMQSPRYEMLEYINQYVGIYDYLMLLYGFGIVFLLIRFLMRYQKTKPKYYYLYIFFLIAMFIVLQNQQQFKIIKYYFKMAELNSAISKRMQLLQRLNLNEKNVSKELLYDKIIIIQGESANKHFLNVYGSPDETTPFLSSLQKKHQLYVFDAISPSNQTRYCVPAMFTDANVTDWYEGYSSSLSLLTLFKQRGYQTFWITNQAMHGFNEDSITNIAMESESQAFLASRVGDSLPDEVLLDYLYKKKEVEPEKGMYVFHLSGSHFKYTKRYTQKHLLYKNPKSIIEEYENSIFYTDYIISQIVQYFEKKKQKILLVYFSDHGEVVHENLSGHGYLPTFKDEYEIPYLVYSSVENPKLDLLKKKNIQHYFNAENMNEMIGYIGGLQENVKPSFSSKIFSLDPKHIFDYEKLHYYK